MSATGNRGYRIARALVAACAVALAGCGDRLPKLVRALEDSPEPARRRKAALGLRRLRDPGAAAPLVKTLGDAHAGVRSAAALALGEIAGFGSDEVRAIERSLSDPAEEVRRAAASARLI